MGAAPGGGSAEDDFSGGTSQRPVASARMGKQPPLLSWEVIKELLMSLETLVWKRFSAPPGLGRRGHVTRPALCGVRASPPAPEGTGHSSCGESEASQKEAGSFPGHTGRGDIKHRLPD